MRKLALFLAFLFLFSPSIALAGNATAATGASGSQLPPSVPQSQGPVAIRAELANGSMPEGMPITISATAGSATATYRLITGREGNFLLQLGNGEYRLNAVLDDMATPGVDFAATTQLSVPLQRNLTMVFYPSGSVAATVLEDGAPVQGAAMHISCASDWFDYGGMNGANAEAGQAGEFLFRALPTGTCIVSASTQMSAGSARVDVAQGMLSSTQVELKRRALALTDVALALGIIAVTSILAYHLFFSRKKQALPHPEAHSEKKSAPQKESRQAKIEPLPEAPALPSLDANSDKARAVLSTLSEREAEIVRLLFSSGGKAKRSTMQHRLLIPKTSLLRNLRSLERKNIVKLTPFGRNLVAELERDLFK
jgi:uncharacterized membrane protein